MGSLCHSHYRIAQKLINHSPALVVEQTCESPSSDENTSCTGSATRVKQWVPTPCLKNAESEALRRWLRLDERFVPGQKSALPAETPMPILNVDDNGPSRYLRSRILERAGFEVRETDCAADPVDARSRPSPGMGPA